MDAGDLRDPFDVVRLTGGRCVRMSACMRTTLVLDDPVFLKAKKRAAELGMTLSEFTTSVLRAQLFAQSAVETPRPAFYMPTCGEPGGLHHSPQELARLRDEGR